MDVSLENMQSELSAAALKCRLITAQIIVGW